jgi:hypothetical protein
MLHTYNINSLEVKNGDVLSFLFYLWTEKILKGDIYLVFGHPVV